MPHLDWQWVATLLVVAAAMLILLRRTWRLFRTSGQHGCGAGCGTCSDPPQAQQVQDRPTTKPFVPLESLRQIKPLQLQTPGSDPIGDE